MRYYCWDMSHQVRSYWLINNLKGFNGHRAVKMERSVGFIGDKIRGEKRKALPETSCMLINSSKEKPFVSLPAEFPMKLNQPHMNDAAGAYLAETSWPALDQQKNSSMVCGRAVSLISIPMIDGPSTRIYGTYFS